MAIAKLRDSPWVDEAPSVAGLAVVVAAGTFTGESDLDWRKHLCRVIRNDARQFLRCEERQARDSLAAQPLAREHLEFDQADRRDQWVHWTADLPPRVTAYLAARLDGHTTTEAAQLIGCTRTHAKRLQAACRGVLARRIET